MIELLKNNSKELLDEVIKNRRYFHMNPELSNNEVKTSKYIENYLLKLSDFTVERIGKTGLVATIKGPNPGNCIALRCDMDALPIQELSSHTYASVNKGIMHACGHDAHMAIMLGLAKNLVKFKDKIKGTIKLIFQAAEEVGGGAEEMIASNNLQEEKLSSIIALHVNPDFPKGTIATKKGLICAGVDSFEVVFIGKAAHGSTPEAGLDTIRAASSFINEVNYQFPNGHAGNSVISIGFIEGGTSANVIAAHTLLKGTFRTIKKTDRKKMIKTLEKIVKDVAKKTKVKINLNLSNHYPPLINNDKLTNKVMEFAIDNLGKKSLIKMKKHVMLAEDFSFYDKLAPTCMYFLGTAENIKYPAQLHTPDFDIDEESMFYGVFLQSLLAFDIVEYF